MQEQIQATPTVHSISNHDEKDPLARSFWRWFHVFLAGILGVVWAYEPSDGKPGYFWRAFGCVILFYVATIAGTLMHRTRAK